MGYILPCVQAWYQNPYSVFRGYPIYLNPPLFQYVLASQIRVIFCLLHCLCCCRYINETVLDQIQVQVELPFLNPVKAIRFITSWTVLGSACQVQVCMDLMFQMILNHAGISIVETLSICHTGPYFSSNQKYVGCFACLLVALCICVCVCVFVCAHSL